MTQQRSRFVEIDGQVYRDDGGGLATGEPVADAKPRVIIHTSHSGSAPHQPSYDKGYADGVARGYDRGHAEGYKQGRNARAVWLLISLLGLGACAAGVALYLTAGGLQ